MNIRHKISISIALTAFFFLLVLILFGDSGLADLNTMKSQKSDLIEENKKIAQENEAIYRQVERLKNDPEYIEHIARQDLGMIGKDEYIIKFKKDFQER